jgi:hypothetical protein
MEVPQKMKNRAHMIQQFHYLAYKGIEINTSRAGQMSLFLAVLFTSGTPF